MGSLQRSTSTRAPWTASRRLQQKRVWLQDSTRASWQMWCEAWEVPWCWCSMTVPRCTWGCEWTRLCLYGVDMPYGASGAKHEECSSPRILLLLSRDNTEGPMREAVL